MFCHSQLSCGNFGHFACCQVKPTALIGRKYHVIPSVVWGTPENEQNWGYLFLINLRGFTKIHES